LGQSLCVDRTEVKKRFFRDDQRQACTHGGSATQGRQNNLGSRRVLIRAERRQCL
jgi:hypothetical protein